MKNKKIKCACGCGTTFLLKDKYGRNRKFIHGHQRRKPFHIRFWNRVKKTNKCWLWLGYKDPNGYGNLNIGGKAYLTHRVSYYIHFGSIPKGMEICHHCDNPSCVNPKHLFLGTHKDNMHDAIKKEKIDFKAMSIKGHKARWGFEYP